LAHVWRTILAHKRELVITFVQCLPLSAAHVATYSNIFTPVVIQYYLLDSYVVNYHIQQILVAFLALLSENTPSLHTLCFSINILAHGLAHGVGISP